MGLLSSAIIAGIIGTGLSKVRKSFKKETERKKTPCLFVDGISEPEFAVIVKRAGKGIKRLIYISNSGPVVLGTVRAQSGISTWTFKLDFNDHGHLTGMYWISSTNSNSKIPKVVGNRIQEAILDYPYCVDDQFYNDVQQNKTTKLKQEEDSAYCPYCGKKVIVLNEKFCAFCGKPFRL